MPLQLKDTKDIAREAVEAELKRKKSHSKRKRGADEDYDSSDSEGGRRGRKKKASQAFLPRQVKSRMPEQEDEEAEDDNYRDRAKERREGKMMEEVDLDVEADGLDLSQVRRERLKHGIRSKAETIRQKEDHIKPFDTITQARDAVRKFLSKSNDQEIPSALKDYLQQTYESPPLSESSIDGIKCGVAGRNIQQSYLVFSEIADISDPRRAWESPREVLQPKPTRHEPALLSTSLLESITNLFARHRSRRPTPGEILKETASTGSGEEKLVDEGNDDDDDDDDDIFGGLEDYVPPSAASNQ